MKSFSVIIAAGLLIPNVFSGESGGGKLETLSVGGLKISEYKKRAAESNEPGVKLINPDFAQGSAGWNLGKGFKIEPAGGMNLSPGLFYERANPDEYSMCTQKISVRPGVKYKFSVSVKCENVTSLKHKNFGAGICFEIWDNDKWICGEYPREITGTHDWTTAEGVFVYTGSNKNISGLVVLYMRKSATGKAWFDDVKVEVADAAQCNIRLLCPKGDGISSAGGKIVVKADLPDKNDPLRGKYCYAALEKDGKSLAVAAAPISEGRIAELDFNQSIPAGSVRLDVKILDPDKKEIIGEKTFRVNVSDRKNIPPNACLIDEKGRAVINGKPFLPVGVYMRNIQREDIERLSKGGFNCVIPYWSQFLKFKDTKKQGVEAVRETLDELNRAGIKIMFSLCDVYDGYKSATGKKFSLYGSANADDFIEKIVPEFKDHPALLGWYICDEMSVDWIKTLEERKEKINSLDPYHPTLIVHYTAHNLELYASTCDILGVDPYPIRSPGVHNMAIVRDLMNVSNNAVASGKGAAIWGVPQFYNTANYSNDGRNPEARAKNYAAPTEEEMRAICLLMLIKGAKGLVGYSYHDIFSKERGAEREAEKRWPEICAVAGDMRALESFALSDNEGPAVKLEVTGGEVYARALSDDKGNIKVLIAGCGPEDSKAVVRIAGAKVLKSKFGGAKPVDGGAYLFEGKGICADILE